MVFDGSGQKIVLCVDLNFRHASDFPVCKTREGVDRMILPMVNAGCKILFRDGSGEVQGSF